MLEWDYSRGVGFLPANPEGVYDEAYLRRYVDYSKTLLGLALAEFRVRFVDTFHRGELLDFGCGAGAFLVARGADRTNGFEVLPGMREKLEALEVWQDPFAQDVDALAAWDVLEHLERPRELLAHVRRWVFLSIPIFRGMQHAITSRHFRPTEHFWYFTERGLVGFMASEGFALIARSDGETKLGRDSIGTYAFARIPFTID